MVWNFDLEGKICRIDKRTLVIEEQLTEVFNELQAQRHCLTLARDQDTDEPFLLKVRYDLHPKDFDHITDLKEHREIITDQYLGEADLVRTVHAIGHGPEFIANATRTQREGFPYPSLKKQLILMKRVPGEFLDEIWMDLSESQLNSIKTQIARIVEHMRVNGKALTEHHPAFLQYDAAADKVYLVDFTFWIDIDPDNIPPIDEESIEVLAFNIWQDHLHENPVL
ncbi:predicted protein [Aspergillus terreus NIH2624]|uniref:Aminoglycoside phosphotransferase domain-containing protein n=1 Tax=Aspergillus terreus (strain NIH 2624 / FGSC A1156) TaxID=341663 RepID=Q0CR88_ASPTN|nr:uncharacterized protein ATEG_03796 [Aspergillus terreus NIH2624]EAU35598.1 predicted protein [Aspergillus terreus NIH2624]